MTTSRVAFALASGFSGFPDQGRIVVFGARADHDLSSLDKHRLHIIQGFYPDYKYFADAGFDVATAPSGDYSGALVFLSRSKEQSRDLIAQAAELVQGGPIVVDGQKHDGVDSILKDCRRLGHEPEEVISKAHGKLFVLHGANVSGWRFSNASRSVNGFHTAPGVFSADGPDPGSVLLAKTLPVDLKGRVCDLGAGWGYLSDRVLKSAKVTECHLVEADHVALDCARQNITDPRAAFHWADARDFADPVGFDIVVTNPPFHTLRAANVELGKDFVRAAARLLGPGGTLWLVANRHLPYESTLSEAFSRVDEVSGDRSFKVFRAAAPVRNKRKRQKG